MRSQYKVIVDFRWYEEATARKMLINTLSCSRYNSLCCSNNYAEFGSFVLRKELHARAAETSYQPERTSYITLFSMQSACASNSYGTLCALYLMNFLLGTFLLFLYGVWNSSPITSISSQDITNESDLPSSGGIARYQNYLRYVKFFTFNDYGISNATCYLYSLKPSRLKFYMWHLCEPDVIWENTFNMSF